MPDGVIATVEHMAQAKQQPLIGYYGAPLFEWSPRVAIDEDIETPIPPQDDNAYVEFMEDHMSKNGSGFDKNKHSNDEHGDKSEEQQQTGAEVSSDIHISTL